MEPTAFSSFQQLVIIAVVFGCGYVTLLASFAIRKSSHLFFKMNNFDKFFISFQWGTGISAGSILAICILSPAISFPNSISEFENIVNGHIFEILGFNCFFMTLHHRVFPNLFIDNLIEDLKKD